MSRHRSTPQPTTNRSQGSRAQRSLLEDFWTQEEETEKEVQEDNGEDRRFHEFFSHSVFNPKASMNESEGSVSRRIQVGLYPADAELLEELFLQSKAAGLKHVSRARILRVALRHFHTCWLNADS